MILTERQKEEFRVITRPLIEWLNENGHPHTCVIVDNTVATFYEAETCFRTEEYWRD